MPSPEANEWTLPKKERPGYIDVEMIPARYQAEDVVSPRLGIVVSLLSDPFFRLFQASGAAGSIEVYVSTPTNYSDGGLIYGEDPDGRDIEWHTDKMNRVVLESLRFGITLHSKDPLEPDEAREAKQQQPPAPSTAVDTTSLVSAVNRLFWVVLIVGLLLVMKAL